MSIAQQERQINEILTSSKSRLKEVEEKLELLDNEKSSIDEDISILEQRVDLIRSQLQRKKKALDSITKLTAESEDAYKKLKQSTRLLLTSVKKECKNVDALLTTSNQEDQDQT